MNSILEYKNVMAFRKYKSINGTNNNVYKNNVSDESNHILDDLNNNVSNNNEYRHGLYIMGDSIQNEYTKSERLDILFHKLHRLEFIDTNGCIMVKPPKLMRSSHIDSTNNGPCSIITLEEKIAKFEEKITLLEKSLNHEEIISLYENRLNKLEDYIICKNKKKMYDEN